MTYFEVIISGLVQGIAEFLPVSSSGHLVLLHHYFGFEEPQVFFDIILHIGTLFAVVVYFWRDIIKMFTSQRKLLWFVIIGTFVTAVIGFTFKNSFESLFANKNAVCFMLFVTAGFLFFGEWAARKAQNTAVLSWPKAVLIGFIQGIAIIPGISRSGSTISTGLFLKLKKEEAVRFSFLLSIPAIFGAFVLKLSDKQGALTVEPKMFLGAAIAFATGLLAIWMLIKSVQNFKLKFFGIYCIIIGIIGLLV